MELNDIAEATTAATIAAGTNLARLYSPDARPASRAELLAAADGLSAAALEPLRDRLGALAPGAGWITDETERADLGRGEWWAVDEVEGAVNLLHGRPEWCVSVALVRDGVPVLAVVHQPPYDRTYTAVAGGGAHLNGRPLRVSAKTALAHAIVETSQVGDESPELQQRIGAALGGLMGRALLVRTTIPTTFPLLSVAEGRSDAFWQYAPALTGVAAGSLLATEAGAVATDLTGAPWQSGADGLLIASPAVHLQALKALGEH